MLEIKHVTKVYKTKGGVDTKALDDVSISFEETGLVFLLGKSGSGKSTLLNVCGGLDEPTSGEVVVKGKSSKDFSGSDFDSYRNTFVGFIFQEYNVLDEFNVEDNIALALELQGKPKDKEKIHKLLQDVELESFAKRKPNTLSGGQKQRIAIARALVKEPQIIMADEPTGALDSATGKQVFDTLKKLSETRLVIVVSHDREFAEIYGDRIVELKDGKIISDVTKAAIPPKALDENVTVIGDNTLNIKKGSKLNKENIKAIQDFVLSCDGDVIITKGEKQIDTFKKANRMSDDGATETFNDTKAEEIELKSYTKEDSKFIRSRLPAGKAIKIGASGLKLKPVRLIFTILLSFIAFTMFGLFSTLMVYDGESVAKSSFMNSEYEFINLSKRYLVKYYYGDNDDPWETDRQTNFTQAEVDEFAKKFGTSTFGYYSQNWSNFEIGNVLVKNNKRAYYKSEINKFAYLAEDNSLRNKINGTYPEKANEICISSYLAETMRTENSEVYSVDDKGSATQQTVSINNANDVIGKNITLSMRGERQTFKITGVIDSGAVAQQYDKLKEETDTGTLSYKYENYLKEGLHLFAAVSQDFYSTYEKYGMFSTGESESVQYFEYCNNELQYKYTYSWFNGNEWEEQEGDAWLSNSVKAFGADNMLKCYFLGGTNKTSLAENEVIMSFGNASEILRGPVTDYFMGLVDAGNFDDRLQIPKMLKENEKDEYGYYRFEYNKEGNGYYFEYQNYEDYKNEYEKAVRNIKLDFVNRNLIDSFREDLQKYYSGRYWNGYLDDDGQWVNEEIILSKEQRLAALNNIVEVLNNVQAFDFTLVIDRAREVNCKLVGFHEIDISNTNNDSESGIYLSQSFMDKYIETYEHYKETIVTNYVKEDGTIFAGIYIPYDKDAGTTDNLFASIGAKNKKANDVFYGINNSLYQSIEMANYYAELLSTVFLWVGVVFAAFSALLMFNFISVSISSKRKEIGILRAVGARGTDVFKIFFSESGIIVGICTVLSLIGTFLGCWFINGLLKSDLGLEVTLFVFGFASVGMMVGIALLVAFISTFLPVYFAARKKPVESIRAL